MTTGDKTETVSDVLRNLSAQDFLNFGLHQVAYIRPVKVDNRPGYAIHAADGTPLSVSTDAPSAIVLARQNDLEPVTLH